MIWYKERKLFALAGKYPSPPNRLFHVVFQILCLAFVFDFFYHKKHEFQWLYCSTVGLAILSKTKLAREGLA